MATFRSEILSTDTTEEIVAKVLARNRRLRRRPRARDHGLAIDILDELAKQGYLVPSPDWEEGVTTTYATGLPGNVATRDELEPGTGIWVERNGNSRLVAIELPSRMRVDSRH